jgi:hypothetical protein
MDTNHIKLPFALRDGVLVHISEVESGLKCNCICPDCKSPLVARKKEGKVTPHFAHHNGNPDCKHALESALHRLAKDIIEEQKAIALPSYGIDHDGRWCLLSSERVQSVDSVILEEPVDNFKPDVIAKVKGHKLLIEIAVTHFADEEKRQKIKHKGISAIEIDLSSLNGAQFDRATLTEIIVNQCTHREWLYNSQTENLLKAELIKQQKIEEEETKRQKNLKVFYEKNRKDIVWIGDKSREHIENCPLKTNDPQSDGLVSLLKCLDCKYYQKEYRLFATLNG